MELTFTHYRILYGADSADLPELLMAMRTQGLPDGDFEWPPLALEVARPALLDLLSAGYVELYGDGDDPLTLDEAVQIVRDDSQWQNPKQQFHELVITDEGMEVFNQLRPQFQSDGMIGKH